jgi:hypothetical protein
VFLCIAGITIASVAKRKGSPCQQENNNSQGGKRTRSSGPELPEVLYKYEVAGH